MLSSLHYPLCTFNYSFLIKKKKSRSLYILILWLSLGRFGFALYEIIPLNTDKEDKGSRKAEFSSSPLPAARCGATCHMLSAELQQCFPGAFPFQIWDMSLPHWARPYAVCQPLPLTLLLILCPFTQDTDHPPWMQREKHACCFSYWSWDKMLAH